MTKIITTNSVAALKSIVRKHTGDIAITIAGPLEYEVFITKKETNLLIDNVAGDNAAYIDLYDAGHYLSISVPHDVD